MAPIEYSEYKSLVDILEESSNDNASTYEDLMKKEKNVLDTVNHVVKHIKESDAKGGLVAEKSLNGIAQHMFAMWPVVIKELSVVKKPQDVADCVTKEGRSVYIGITLVLLAFFLFALS